MDQMTDISIIKLLAASIFIFIALFFSMQFKIQMEKDIIIAAIRSLLQLLAIGYVLTFIFKLESPIYTIIMVTCMAGIAAENAGRRSKKVRGSYWISAVAVFSTTIVTIGILSGFEIVSYKPQYMIPVAGMVIGNVMSATSLALLRMHDELKRDKNQIEAALSLGASPRKAVELALKKAIETSMIPVIDRAKTVGIVSLPGGMSGMILAGASPLVAVKFQIVIMYMLLGSPFLTVAIASVLGYRQYFTKYMQLRL